ncbi:MAG: cation:proton antiporter [Tissierellia bacterium]|nr:cation:proton antiporter [Tissierellia bacterium]
MDVLFKLGIVVFVGLLGGRLASHLKLPNVSGYIIAGLLIGPSFINLIKSGEAAQFDIINELALAAIAFSIGSEFLLKDLKRTGADVLLIAVAEVVGAYVVVFGTMYFVFKQPFEFSLVIASMSAATAPAGILMVIRQLKANGPLVKTILPVVAIDDALGIMVFGISLPIAKLTSGSGTYSILKIVGTPIMEIVGSILLGAILGFILSYIAPKSKNREEQLSITVGFIILGSGMSNYFNLSPLLTCMMMGAMLINLMHNSHRVFNLVNDFAPPIYLLFFTIAGASLDLSILATVGAIGVGYIFARAGGKILGASIGAKAVKAPDKVVKYLGMSLLTQGGISIGLSIIVAKQLPQFSDSIIAVILFSVLVFEIMGPILAKIGITKAGEVNGALKKTKDAKITI